MRGADTRIHGFTGASTHHSRGRPHLGKVQMIKMIFWTFLPLSNPQTYHQPSSSRSFDSFAPLSFLPSQMLALLPSLLAAATTVNGSPVKIITVGDSITVTQGTQCYPSQLATLLGPGYEVSNQGSSGHTMLINGLCGASPGGSWRRPCIPMPPSNVSICSGNCSYWSTQQFLNTTNPVSSPDIITIMLGTNDAK